MRAQTQVGVRKTIPRAPVALFGAFLRFKLGFFAAILVPELAALNARLPAFKIIVEAIRRSEPRQTCGF